MNKDPDRVISCWRDGSVFEAISDEKANAARSKVPRAVKHVFVRSKEPKTKIGETNPTCSMRPLNWLNAQGTRVLGVKHRLGHPKHGESS